MIILKKFRASALFDWGTMWEAPLKVMKWTPDQISMNPECCPFVNHGLLSYQSITMHAIPRVSAS